MIAKTLPEPTTPFDFSHSVVEIFTEGDCLKLSQLVNAEAGFTVITMSDEDDIWCHVANLLPDGRVLDIEGIWEAKEWVENWEIYLYGETRYLKQWAPSEFESRLNEWNLESPQFSIEENLFYAREVITLSGIAHTN